MTASYSEIRSWVYEAKKDPDITHLIVVRIADDYSFPHVVHKDLPIQRVLDSLFSDGFRVDEIYAMHLSLEDQLMEHRAFHPEYPDGCPEGPNYDTVPEAL